MAEPLDDKFYDRADAFIHLANVQCDELDRGKVSASFLYSVARFNAWIIAMKCSSTAELSEAREEAVEYFCKQYRAMLLDNVDDYIKNFDKYMKI
jgi:hypothetical protein